MISYNDIYKIHNCLDNFKKMEDEIEENGLHGMDVYKHKFPQPSAFCTNPCGQSLFAQDHGTTLSGKVVMILSIPVCLYCYNLQHLKGFIFKTYWDET